MKNWKWQELAVIGSTGLLLVVVLYVILRNVFRPARDERQIDEDIISSGLDPLSVKLDAQEVYSQLGLDGPFGIPWPWENEAAVIKIIEKYTSTTYPALARTYSFLYGRQLTRDLKKYLSKTDFADIGLIAS